MPGGIIHHPGGRTIGEAENVWLAWVTHNASDSHGNADAARHTEWGQPLVLGLLTVAIVIGLAQPSTGPPGSATAVQEAAWEAITLRRPVVAGDTIRAESHFERVDVDASSSGQVWRTILGIGRDGEVVVSIREQRRVPRRPAVLRGG